MAVTALAAGNRHLRDQQSPAIAQPTAPLTRTARIRNQLTALDAQREPCLEHFGRVEATVTIDRDDAIVAVLAVATAPSAGHQVVASEVFVVLGMHAAKHEIRSSTAFGRHCP